MSDAAALSPDSANEPPSPAFLSRAGSVLAVVVLGTMTAIPLIEMVSRRLLGRALIPGASGYVEHLTLWIAFVGGALAAAHGRHLALSTTAFLKPGRLLAVAQTLSALTATLVTLALAWGSLGHVQNERQFTDALGGGLPKWYASLIMPLGYLAVAVSFWWRAPGAWRGRLWVLGGVAVAVLAWLLGVQYERMLVPGTILLCVSALFGAPLFAVLGGLAAVFFHALGESMSALAIETYSLATMPLLPTLPLFALAGTVLAAGKSSERLVGLFRALFGWAPGGSAVAAVVACAFFTAVTGASGVTILALAGLLLPVLVEEGYPERFSIGLLTASGSIGLLFPPSMPVILYGIRAEQEIEQLFLAGLIPGILIVGGIAGYSAWRGVKAGVTRRPVGPGATLRAVWVAKWDLFLPVFVILSLLTGMTSLVETAALTAAYAIFIEFGVHRSLSARRHVSGILRETAVLMGALLFILGSALALTGYMVGEEVPARIAEWVGDNVSSRLVFLLILNLLLLVAGMLIDIFSAIIIIVPLIVPMSRAFDIDPLHLGIIFLANLELGYLTPPVGLNLFLSSLRFRRGLVDIWKMVIPFLVLFGVWVLLITYVPAVTMTLK